MYLHLPMAALATPAADAAAPVVATATTLQPAGSVGGAVLALLLVVALILALAWLARRMPGLGGGTTPGLRLVGSLSLGPRERVAVVEVGGTQLLLGIAHGGIRALHTLAEPLPERAPAASPFAQLLAQLPGKKP